MATIGDPGRSRASKSRPADRWKPKVPSHPGVISFTHDIRSLRDSVDPAGTAIIEFMPARARGVVNDTPAAATPGTLRAASANRSNSAILAAPSAGLRSTLAVTSRTPASR